MWKMRGQSPRKHSRHIMRMCIVERLAKYVNQKGYEWWWNEEVEEVLTEKKWLYQMRLQSKIGHMI